jgi:hypothetical protein
MSIRSDGPRYDSKPDQPREIRADRDMREFSRSLVRAFPERVNALDIQRAADYIKSQHPEWSSDMIQAQAIGVARTKKYAAAGKQFHEFFDQMGSHEYTLFMEALHTDPYRSLEMLRDWYIEYVEENCE